MFQGNRIEVQAFWDSEAQVWVATSEDVPGLVTEAETTEKLLDKLKTLVPELLEANGLLGQMELKDIPVHLLSQRTEIIRCRLP